MQSFTKLVCFSFDLLDPSPNFVIDRSSGDVKTLTKISCLDLDDLDQMPISLAVRATDSGERQQLSTDATLEIQIIGFHTYFPSFLPSNEYTVNISENMPPQTCFLKVENFRVKMFLMTEKFRIKN